MCIYFYVKEFKHKKSKALLFKRRFIFIKLPLFVDIVTKHCYTKNIKRNNVTIGGKYNADI